VLYVYAVAQVLHRDIVKVCDADGSLADSDMSSDGHFQLTAIYLMLMLLKLPAHAFVFT
jgi:hypothetical protein